MHKKIINGWEELTGFKAKVSKTGNVIYFHDPKTIYSDSVMRFNVDNTISFNINIPQEWLKGFYELSKGNIFWKDKEKTEIFHELIDSNEESIKEELWIIHRAEPDGGLSSYGRARKEVIKWIKLLKCL